jgi:eukaryotic-like serine/threonine-protein kinase
VTALGGIRFGNFTLFRRLARGGMAEVFLARQNGLEGFDRRCAVKRILPHLADSSEFISMFLREAKLAARLSHPNIVHIYDFGKVGTDYFIAMEFVDGVTAGELISRCANDPMPPVLIARLGADAAAALHHAHELRGDNGKALGLVHRDVSPANVMVSYDGVVKVVDFGIAKAAELTGDKTNPGTVKGKYAYMSPEQTIAAQLDGRSDVFSLSIVLWELVAGRPIVERGDRVAAMRAIRDGRLQPLDRVAPHTPPALVEAISWGLARRREERPNAAELAQALEAFIKASPELATSMHVAAWVRPRFQPAAESVARNSDGTSVGNTSAEVLGTQGSLSEEDLAATIPVQRMSAAEIFGAQTRATITPRAARPSNVNVASGTIGTEAVSALPPPRRSPTGMPAPGLPAPPAAPVMLARSPMGTVAEVPLSYEEGAAPRQRRLLVALVALALIAGAFAFTRFVIQPMLANRDGEPAPAPPVATPLPDPGAVPAPNPTVAPIVDARPGEVDATVDAAGLPSATDAGPVSGGAAPDGGVEATPAAVDDAQPPHPRGKQPRSRNATLEIIAKPADAVIAIDNLPPQRSPARFTLAAGPHRLRVDKPGYEGARRAVDLSEGQRKTIELTLPRAVDPSEFAAANMARLSVSTTPSSTVFLGPRSLGTSPIDAFELAPGTYTLTFKQAGRDPVDRKITLGPHENLKLNVDLP